MRDKVAQRLAVRAALDTPNVQPHSAGLDNFTGQSLPQAQVTIAANRATAHLKIAVMWPAPVVEVARAVQHNVVDVLTKLAGLDVDRVDVTVSYMSPPAAAHKRVQ